MGVVFTVFVDCISRGVVLVVIILIIICERRAWYVTDYDTILNHNFCIIVEIHGYGIILGIEQWEAVELSAGW